MRAEVLAPALQSSVAPKGCGPSVGIKEIFPAGRRLGTDQPDPSTRLAWPASWHHPRGRNRQGRGTLSRSQETGGHGLGLAVLRGGTLFHDGELILQNRTGGGLTALLRLPILRTDTQNSGEPGDTGRELADVAFTIIAITRGGSGMKRRDFMAGIGAAQVVLSSIPTVALAHGVQAYDAMVPVAELPTDYLPREVTLEEPLPPFEIHVEPSQFALYWTLPEGRAMRYTVEIGRQGLYHTGEYYIGAKKEWPSWTPIPAMIRRNPGAYARYADGMPGGPTNPLGAWALYLFSARARRYLSAHSRHLPAPRPLAGRSPTAARGPPIPMIRSSNFMTVCRWRHGRCSTRCRPSADPGAAGVDAGARHKVAVDGDQIGHGQSLPSVGVVLKERPRCSLHYAPL